MGAKAKRLTREERLRKAGFLETTVQEFLDPLAVRDLQERQEAEAEVRRVIRIAVPQPRPIPEPPEKPEAA